MLFGEWFCVGRLDDLGLGQPGRRGRRRRGGRVGAGDQRRATARCTRRTTSAGTGAPSSSRAEPGRRAGRAARPAALRCPYHSWTYSLAGRLLRAPHADGSTSTRRTSRLHPVAVEEWGGFVFVHLTPAAAAPLADGVARAGGQPRATTRMGALVTGLRLSYDVAANYKVLAENYNECYHCGPVHPELVAAGAGVRRAAATDLDWDDGIPHREGAWTFTMSGTTNRAPLPGLDEAEKARHKGELVYPNLMLSCSADHVAAFVLRPRRRRPHRGSSARCCSRATPSRPPTSTRPTPATSGTWSTSRTGRSASPCSAGCRRGLHARLVRPDGGRQRRHPALAAAQARTGPAMTEHVRRRRRRARRPRQRGRDAAGARAASASLGLERFELGHTRGASHDTSAGSSGTATTRRRTSG